MRPANHQRALVALRGVYAAFAVGFGTLMLSLVGAALLLQRASTSPSGGQRRRAAAAGSSP
ncbi:MAG: hypothetical protein ABEJ04_02765 [Halobacteriaceae archaeon]